MVPSKLQNGAQWAKKWCQILFSNFDSRLFRSKFFCENSFQFTSLLHSQSFPQHHKSIPNLLQEIYFLVFHMPKKWTEVNIDIGLNLDLAAFWYFDGFGFYNFCLTRCGLDLITLFWTSSQLLIQFWDCRLLYWIVWLSGVSKICRDCLLCLFEC